MQEIIFEKNKTYLGDCLEIMQQFPDGIFDMILCDLPYGITQNKWDNIIPLDKLWEQYKRIIKANGAIVLFGSEPFSSMLRVSNIDNFKYDWVWNKINIKNRSFKLKENANEPTRNNICFWI
jgi:site-specific DNA-methyltransferase (adenine-specific)